MPKYRFLTGFSLSGFYYAEGTVAELDTETADMIPEGVAMPASEPAPELAAEPEPEAEPELAPLPQQKPPPKGSKVT